MNRRHVLSFIGAGAFTALGARAETIAPLNLPDAEWKKRLPADAYEILRHEATERPFTSPLLDEHRKGTFVCLGCDLPLFKSDTKFDSGTGWPSFYQPIQGHVKTQTDFKLIVPRTEYHCAKCGGHHGHVFDDGPRPTGLRYCNNGAALKFVAG
ncbi:MAG: peptide-methionine (R)-S-oxide reductase MsrB [Asticcacaulis sp.]|nr:peptide-methionine (R)-S-oxide reductase MsrB [Asticcacaulis sp.]